MKTLVATRQVACASNREALWPALSDTERLNRVMGMPALTVTPAADGAARFSIAARIAGLNLHYYEEPFEWREPEELSIRRRFTNGPVESYRMQMKLADTSPGTSVEVTLEITPRSLLAWPFARLNLGGFVQKLCRAIATIDDNLQAGADPSRGAKAAHVDSAALAQARAKLEAALPEGDRALAGRVVEYVQNASDAELVRIRPYELADRWQISPRQLLYVCLHGVVAGLFDLQWEIICPSCRVAADTVTTLAALSDEAHCQLCDISIGVDLDRAVEATVRPARAIRAVAMGPFCIGGPFRTPHVLTQAILPASGGTKLLAPATTGRYRLFSRGGATCSVDVVATGVDRADVHAASELSPGQLAVTPKAPIDISEKSGHERHVKIERLEWASHAATAHDVATAPAFRRLFSAEVLRPGLSLRVTRAALVFTDLAGSTALYADVGDAAAYAVVQAHFDALAKACSENGGAVVKTIGDAVMAAFTTDEDAARAAMAMLRAYRRLAADDVLARRMRLRVGGFCGPCYLVTANERLDYFGQSVNTAARVQQLSQGDEAVLPAELALRGIDEGWLTDVEIAETFAATLKGVDAPVKVSRVRLVTPSTEPAETGSAHRERTLEAHS